MWEYTDKVRDHLLNPRNVGEVKEPDGIGEVGNIKCGDALRLTFRLGKDKTIEDIRFKTFGCGSAIASSSILTEMVKGKSLDEAAKVTNKDIAEALGGLPLEKMHCSVMGQEALQKAIEFYKNGGVAPEEQEKEGTVVCSCFNVTDMEIEKAITQNHLTTVEDVTHYTKAGGGCGGCIPQIEEILARVNGKPVPQKPATSKPMTTLEKIDAIRKVLDIEIRPLLQQDGGDLELVDIEGNTVLVRFTGHCKGCSFLDFTKCQVVEKKLQEKVHPDLVAKQVE